MKKLKFDPVVALIIVAGAAIAAFMFYITHDIHELNRQDDIRKQAELAACDTLGPRYMESFKVVGSGFYAGQTGNAVETNGRRVRLALDNERSAWFRCGELKRVK